MNTAQIWVSYWPVPAPCFSFLYKGGYFVACIVMP